MHVSNAKDRFHRIRTVGSLLRHDNIRSRGDSQRPILFLPKPSTVVQPPQGAVHSGHQRSTRSGSKVGGVRLSRHLGARATYSSQLNSLLLTGGSVGPNQTKIECSACVRGAGKGSMQSTSQSVQQRKRGMEVDSDPRTCAGVKVLSKGAPGVVAVFAREGADPVARF